MSRDEKRNSEGYIDLTPFNAMERIETEEQAKRLIAVLKYIIKHSEFELAERIHIRHKKTGREFK